MQRVEAPPKRLDLRSMERAREFIQANLHERLSVADIATAAGFDGELQTFVRTFKRFSGASPYRYITQARMGLAKALLERGGRNVTEVAIDSGFNNLSHFSDAFRRYSGCPPTSVLGRKLSPANG